MPKNKYKQPSIVSGLSIKDIVNMDLSTFNSLTFSDMQKVVGRLVSAVNKRLRRFEKAGINTPATRALEKTGGALSTRGKDIQQLRNEYARARNFLNMETSTQAGFRSVQKRTVETLQARGVDITRSELDELFEVWNDLTELDPTIEQSKDKYSLMQDIANMPDDMDIDDKILKAKELSTTLYEQQQGREVTLYGVSGFFEL